MEEQIITLPLSAGVSRCLGYGETKGKYCNSSSKCARHMTIHQLTEPWPDVKPPFYRMCNGNDTFLMEFIK